MKKIIALVLVAIAIVISSFQVFAQEITTEVIEDMVEAQAESEQIVYNITPTINAPTSSGYLDITGVVLWTVLAVLMVLILMYMYFNVLSNRKKTKLLVKKYQNKPNLLITNMTANDKKS